MKINNNTLKNYFLQNIPFVVFILAYIVLRFYFLNINYTEWGDTFRMIRGAEFISHLSWPWDEKRWPLYSIFLVPGVWINNPILWGRVLGVFISVAHLGVLYVFFQIFFEDLKKHTSIIKTNLNPFIKFENQSKKVALASIVLTSLTSVYAYWSIRVMADPLFSLLVSAFILFFVQIYKTADKNTYKKQALMSLLLLAITMARLEGLFMLFALSAYFLVFSRWKDLFVFWVPQILVYIPWTLYAKVLYKGPVENDYLNEVQTFSFDLNRLAYFLTYTSFILVFSVLAFYMLKFTASFVKSQWEPYKDRLVAFLKTFGKESKDRVDSPMLIYMPLVLFVMQEFLIGFIWTPSLPRIYMPVIPYLVFFAVCGFYVYEIVQQDKVKNNLKNLFWLLLSVLVFGIAQYKFKLYFLGASKSLFVLLNLLAIFYLLVSFSQTYIKKSLVNLKIASIIVAVLLSTITVVHNQKDVYKSVKTGLDFVRDQEGIVAYSDETGNSSWYLKERGYYLPYVENPVDLDEQYSILKENDVKYMLWTDEFNRGSAFINPKHDPRYNLIAVFSVPIKDLLDSAVKTAGVDLKEPPAIFTTKVYEIK